MTVSKAVFTSINDIDGEKMTTIIEYGPFDSSNQHVLDALIRFLTEKDPDMVPQEEIITDRNRGK